MQMTTDRGGCVDNPIFNPTQSVDRWLMQSFWPDMFSSSQRVTFKQFMLKYGVGVNTSNIRSDYLIW